MAGAVAAASDDYRRCRHMTIFSGNSLRSVTGGSCLALAFLQDPDKVSNQAQPVGVELRVPPDPAGGKVAKVAAVLSTDGLRDVQARQFANCFPSQRGPPVSYQFHGQFCPANMKRCISASFPLEATFSDLRLRVCSRHVFAHRGLQFLKRGRKIQRSSMDEAADPSVTDFFDNSFSGSAAWASGLHLPSRQRYPSGCLSSLPRPKRLKDFLRKLYEISVSPISALDSFISAELPDPLEKPVLHELVKRFHDPRGSRCNIDDQCIYGRFRPCPLSSARGGLLGDSLYTGCAGVDATHIFADVFVFLYLFKYLFKGPDRTRFGLQALNSGADGDENAAVDEFADYMNARYLSASVYRICNFDSAFRSAPTSVAAKSRLRSGAMQSIREPRKTRNCLDQH
ncbi:hypothetical protein V8E54_008783 [Elaphomyces granulatus]